MTTTMTQRDRAIALFLPAIMLILGFGIWLIWTGKYGEITKANKEMALAEEVAPTKDKLLQQQLRVMRAAKQAEEAVKSVAEARGKFLHTLRCTDPVHRAERIHTLTTLLSNQGLVVIEHTEADAGKDRLPTRLEAFAKKLPIASPPKLHRIKFLSRYPDACQLTASLSQDGAVAIPVGLTMKESTTDTDWHEWTLLVWV